MSRACLNRFHVITIQVTVIQNSLTWHRIISPSVIHSSTIFHCKLSLCLLKVQQYQGKMCFDVTFFTEYNLQVLFFYLFTYCINSQNPHFHFSIKRYVFALLDSGHLWQDGSHLGFLGHNDVITSNWCYHRNPRCRRSRKSVFIHDLWQCPLFRVPSSVAGFAMKPHISLLQMRGG